MPNDVHRGKLVVVGDGAVGKTAICQTFATDGREFPKNYNMTLGAEVHTKQILIPGTDDAVDLIIFDSASLDIYMELYDSFWKSPDLLMIVYDVTNSKSLEAVNDWISITKQVGWKNNKPIASVLFANKIDLSKRKICEDSEGIKIADNYSMKFFSGSAKINQGLEDPFRYLANALYQHKQN